MKQNILEFNFKFKSSEFFVTEKNMFAYNFIKKWPDWQQTLVYLYGPEKCGKTTISQMWLEASKGIYLSSENFDEFLLNFRDWSGVKECKSCRSRKMLQNASFLAIVAVHTAEI